MTDDVHNGTDLAEWRSAGALSDLIHGTAPILLLVLVGGALLGLIPLWLPVAGAPAALVAFALLSRRMEGPSAFALFSVSPAPRSPSQLILRAAANSAYYLFLGATCYLVFRWVVVAPILVRLPVFLVGGTTLAGLAYALSKPRGRAAAVNVWTTNYGQHAPVGALLAVGLAATALFASAGLSLDRMHPSWFLTPAGTSSSFERFSWFFVWHFLDAIPFLDINKTLNLPTPFEYRSMTVGILLLAYKLLLIAPAIATFVNYWSVQNSILGRIQAVQGEARSAPDAAPMNQEEDSVDPRSNSTRAEGEPDSPDEGASG